MARTTRHRGARESETEMEHVPVLLSEVVDALARPGALLIDGTVGDGGHAAALLDASGPAARLLGLDLDQESLGRAKSALTRFGSRVDLCHESFAHVAQAAARAGMTSPTGILFDLGMATHHLAVERGFSFHTSGPLDMRYDPTGTIPLPAPTLPALHALAAQQPAYTAADVLTGLRADDLATVFRVYGEERHAARIADAIVQQRRRAPVQTVPELTQLIVRAVPSRARHGRIHVATRTFQALRIAVNREWETLDAGITGALSLLAPSGRLAVIAFHSGEDRIVKRLLRAAAAEGRVRLLTKRPLRPPDTERARNPRSRSARLRIAERRPDSSHPTPTVQHNHLHV